MRFPFVIAWLLALAASAFAQSNTPNGAITQGLVWTPPQWNLAWQSKMDWPPSQAIPLFAWTTATRPISPTAGFLGYNTTLASTEFWNGAAWVSGGSGGTVTFGAGATTANPRITGDATSGFYSPGANQIGLATGGIQRMLLNGSAFAFSGTMALNSQPMLTIVGTPGVGNCLSAASATSAQDAGVGACGAGGGGGSVNGPGASNTGDLSAYGNSAGSLLADPSLGTATAANISAPGGSASHNYVPADTITLIGGTGTTNTILTVGHTQVSSATIAAAGTGGTPGTQTVTGTTGTGTPFQASVTVSGGGAITAVLSILVGGDYSVNPTGLTAEPVTGGSLSGAQLNIKMGVKTATITTAGAYTVAPSNPVAQGASSGVGLGATFNMAWSIGVANIDASNNFNLARGFTFDTTGSINMTGHDVFGTVVKSSMPWKATTQSTTGPEFAFSWNMISNKAGGDKVVHYSSMEMQPGSGSAWTRNPVMVVDSGVGAAVAAQLDESDFVNRNVNQGDPGTAPGFAGTGAQLLYTGISIAGGGEHTSLAGTWVGGVGWSYSTLNGAIGSGTTSIAINAPPGGSTAFPTAFPFTLMVGGPTLPGHGNTADANTEVITVSAGTVPGTITVTRGANGSVSLAHPNGANVQTVTWNRAFQSVGHFGYAELDSEAFAPYWARVNGAHSWGLDLSGGILYKGAILLPATVGGTACTFSCGAIMGIGAGAAPTTLMFIDSTNALVLGGAGVAGITALNFIQPALNNTFLGGTSLRWNLFATAGNFSGTTTISGNNNVSGSETVGGSMTASGGLVVNGSASYALDLASASAAGSIRLQTGAAIYGGTVPILNYSSNNIVLGNNTESNTYLFSQNINFPNLLHYTGLNAGAVCYNSPGSVGTLSYNDAFAGSCDIASAEKYKLDIKPFKPARGFATARAEVMAIEPITYKLKDARSINLGDLPGFSANQMAILDPRLAIVADGEVESIRYPLISALHAAALQEIITEQDELKAQIAELRACWPVDGGERRCH